MKTCPECGYQSGFWTLRPIRYYCPECGRDVKPGREQVKEWQRSAYVIGVASGAMGSLLMMGFWVWIFMAQIEKTPTMAPDYGSWLLLATMALLLGGLAFMMPMELARMKRHEREGLLEKGSKKKFRKLAIGFIPAGIVAVAFLLAKLLPAEIQVIGMILAACLIMVLGVILKLREGIAVIRESLEPLTPIRWNEDSQCFEEVT